MYETSERYDKLKAAVEEYFQEKGQPVASWVLVADITTLEDHMSFIGESTIVRSGSYYAQLGLLTEGVRLLTDAGEVINASEDDDPGDC